MRGIVPDPLEIDDAGGDVERGGAVFAEVAFMNEGILAEALAGELEHLAVGGGGGVGFVVEAAVWAWNCGCVKSNFTNGMWWRCSA